MGDISGPDWSHICSAFDCQETFLLITDEDGEELALRIDQIEMFVGTEIDRYSEEQLNVIPNFRD